MRELLLVRHGHAASNDADVVSGAPPGGGLSARGREQADALRALLADEPLDLAVCTELRRTVETLERGLGGRDVPVEVHPALNEIRFGAFEGGPLEAYRAWAWSTPAGEVGPGDAESRAAVAARVAEALEALLGRDAERILVVGHALPVRYILDAAVGLVPVARITPVPHATPHLLDAEAVAGAAELLRAWAAAPAFAAPRVG